MGNILRVRDVRANSHKICADEYPVLYEKKKIDKKLIIDIFYANFHILRFYRATDIDVIFQHSLAKQTSNAIATAPFTIGWKKTKYEKPKEKKNGKMKEELIQK